MFNVVCSTLELNNMLSLARQAAVSKVGSSLDGIQLVAKDNKLTIVSQGQSVTIACDINATVLEEGTVIVPVMLADIVAKQPGDQITIIQNDNRVIISGKTANGRKTESKLSILDKPFISEKSPEDSQIVFSGDHTELASALSLAQYAISTDENRIQLTGLLFEAEKGASQITSLDGFRMANIPLKGTTTVPEGEKASGIIPRKSVEILAKISRNAAFGENTVLSFSPNACFAKCGEDIRFSSTLIVGEYIDYRRILPESFAVSAKMKKADFVSALSRCAIFAHEGKNKIIKLKFENDVCRLSASGMVGDISDEVECEMDEKEKTLEIAFNSSYLNDSVKMAGDEFIVFKMNSPVKPVVITDCQSTSTHLLLPTRVLEDTKIGAA